MPFALFVGLAVYMGVGNFMAHKLPPHTNIAGHVTFCRPQCYSDNMVPWPFRKSHYHECALENDRDICTAEIYRGEKWIPLPKDEYTSLF